jgi:hypothetical protein
VLDPERVAEHAPADPQLDPIRRDVAAITSV